MSDNITISIGFSICAFIFLILIIIMYTSKKKFKNIENSLFLFLLVLSCLLIISEFFYVYCLTRINEIPGVTRVACRAYLYGIIIWMGVFIFYIITQLTRHIEDRQEKNKIRKKCLIILAIILFIITGISSFLPIEYYDYSEHLYVFGGPAVYPAYLMGAACMFTMIYGLLYKNKELTGKQKGPLAFAIAFVISITILQFFVEDADYNMQNFQFATLLMALFFTLENQDNKLLKEHEEQRIEAEKANKEQTEFLTSMSHEIRTPMSTIMGFSDALIREGANNKEVVNSDVNNIHAAAVKLLDLINNILDLSRIESQKETIVEKDFETTPFIVDLNDTIKTKIDSMKVKLDVIIDENIPSKLYGDSVKVSKIVSNLISNIISYTKFGSIILNIKNSQKDNEYAFEIDISSDGSEIDEDDYEKYYTNDNTENVVNNNILGLNVAKMYAKMLNTNIVMTSSERENIGYKIAFNFQIIDAKPIGNIHDLLNPKEIDTTVNIEGKKILIVDDNMINIKLLKRLLAEYKLDIESCTSGNECLDKVREKDYDLIFLDHMMPGMDGIETLNALKDIKQNLPPIIALTANSFSGVKETYVNAGFTDYLAKPINRNELNKLLITTLK